MKTAELVTSTDRDVAVFPAEGRRLLVYVVYDTRGDVEEYIPYALEHLRPHCDRIIAVVNGRLTEAGRTRLAAVSDEIVQRDNRGYDIWGYKAGLDAAGDDVSEFDEVLLANDTWYGPVRPFEPVFDRMNARPVHFWGMTDHVRVEPHPFTNSGYLPYHLQSYWFAARRDLVQSSEWRNYWRDLPAMDSYADAVVKHEAVFTEFLTDRGFVGEVAYPTITDKIENHSVLYAEQLLEVGCPTLKRRPFFQWPPFLDRTAVVGTWTLQAAQKHGYPTELITRDLARRVAPKTLHTDAALMNVLGEGASSYDDAKPLRIAVVAHIHYPEMAEQMLTHADFLPGSYDLFVTVSDTIKAQQIEQIINARGARGGVDVRVVESNDGRDQSAFLIGCRDVVLSDSHDVIVKIHSKKTPQDDYGPGRHFRNQQFDNLLRSPGYASNVLALFQDEPGLGIVFPPMVHIGYGTLGHGWWANRERFCTLAEQLGIHVPVDESSPLAPYGSMYVVRPEALRPLVERKWTYSDFGGSDAYQDGGLAHVLERMPAYAAGERGFYARTVANRDYFAASYTGLDYLLDQFSLTLPEGTQHQIEFLRRTGGIGTGSLPDMMLMLARGRHPAWAGSIERWIARTDRLRGALWRARHPRTWLPRSRA